MKKSYSELLKDPRWQKKRLEVLEYYGFCCDRCQDESTTLHVHHNSYISGRKPWEYEPEQLIVLCEKCHDITHKKEDPLSVISSYIKDSVSERRDLVAYFLAGFISLGIEETESLIGEMTCFEKAFYLTGENASAESFHQAMILCREENNK